MKNIIMREILLNLIPNEKERAITGRELTALTGIKLRQLKILITELRMDYPICSKETEGGGYWMAESDEDIKEFIKMISRRRDGYNRTIEVMKNHIR